MNYFTLVLFFIHHLTHLVPCLQHQMVGTRSGGLVDNGVSTSGSGTKKGKDKQPLEDPVLGDDVSLLDAVDKSV